MVHYFFALCAFSLSLFPSPIPHFITFCLFVFSPSLLLLFELLGLCPALSRCQSHTFCTWHRLPPLPTTFAIPPPCGPSCGAMATAAPLVLLLLILQLCSRGAPPGALAALIQPQRTNTGPQQTKTQADEPRRLRPKDLVVTTVALQYVPGIPFRRGQNALPPPARDSAAKATTTPKKTTTTTGRDPVFVPRRQDSGPQRTARMYSYEDVLKHNYV